MARKLLAESVAEELLGRILRGEVGPDETLPAEAQIAQEFGTSRLTVREALRTLQARHIVQVRRGLGTYVNPPESWTDLESILRAASRGVASHQVALRLLEVRRMVESGSAELAARRATTEDLARMRQAIEDLERAHAAADLEAVTRTDLAFHDALLRASGNPFVPVLLGQLGQLLYTARRDTSAFPAVQRRAIHHHKLVLEAVASGDPEKARRTMEEHIDQTHDDYERYIAHTSTTGDE